MAGFENILAAIEKGRVVFQFPSLVDSRYTVATVSEKDYVERKELIFLVRLLFVRMLKVRRLMQRGEVPTEIFDIEFLNKILKNFKPYDVQDCSYYNAILQNLFFAVLANPKDSLHPRMFAKEIGRRGAKTSFRYSSMFALPEDDIVALFDSVDVEVDPIFECLDTEISQTGKKCHRDGFSREPRASQRARISNSLFFYEGEDGKGLIPLLKDLVLTDDAYAELIERVLKIGEGHNSWYYEQGLKE
ncbi:MAG: hypothetical protein IKV67_02785 [Paludibacteraceae bacterium]|nr:hypothetical protein [Paludibacteraceae bacterium]